MFLSALLQGLENDIQKHQLLHFLGFVLEKLSFGKRKNGIVFPLDARPALQCPGGPANPESFMNTLRIAQLQSSCKQKSYVLFCPGNKRNIYQAQETAAAAQTASPPAPDEFYDEFYMALLIFFIPHHGLVGPQGPHAVLRRIFLRVVA